ncbi:MAG: macro domain-containing protein [Candidatus Aquilonibacter sp.]
MNVVTAEITTLDVDAIVNAANEGLVRGGGVCGAIFRAAGAQLVEACRAVAPCPTGEARITPGFSAKARWIVHAVGPIWRGGSQGEAALLASAYRAALDAAAGADARSIAFPAISTGIYGYPSDAAADVAIAAVTSWLDAAKERLDVIVCAFNEADAQRYRARLG